MNNDWLKELKAGDKVIVVTGGFNARRTVEIVEKATATQIVLPRGARYRKSDGDLIGRNRWHQNRLEQATPEAVVAANEAKRVLHLDARLSNVKWGDVPLAKLERIAKILDESEPAPATGQQEN